MRRFDKKNNIINANILVEQRYFKSKGLISENEFVSNIKSDDLEAGGNNYEYQQALNGLNSEPNTKNYSMESDNFNSDLEMSYYNIIKEIESKIKELRSDFNQNEGKIYKLETLSEETNRLINYLSEIR